MSTWSLIMWYFSSLYSRCAAKVLGLVTNLGILSPGHLACLIDPSNFFITFALSHDISAGNPTICHCSIIIRILSRIESIPGLISFCSSSTAMLSSLSLHTPVITSKLTTTFNDYSQLLKCIS